jgi:hypothetical protein
VGILLNISKGVASTNFSIRTTSPVNEIKDFERVPKR